MSSLWGCRAAVIGVCGIAGRHAKWGALDGAELVAFAGVLECPALMRFMIRVLPWAHPRLMTRWRRGSSTGFWVLWTCFQRAGKAYYISPLQVEFCTN
jgi:hypothetical protein